MPRITRPAVQIVQGNLTLFLTYVTPRDFNIPGFYDVDALESDTNEGYQRILNKTRAGRITRHLKEAYPYGYAHLPTTIFLATDKIVKYNENRNEISFLTQAVCPFSVVDGQHRIAGLREAAQDQPHLLDFKMPATIGVQMDNVTQMYHFYMVNTTQAPVEKALGQQITKRFTDMQGVHDLPYLPYWLERDVSEGTDAQAIELIKVLNEEQSSPVRHRFHMANDSTSGRGKIKQASYVNVLKAHVFTPNNPVSGESSEKLRKIMLNYFIAIDNLFVPSDRRDTSRVYQNNGLFFFTAIAKYVFIELYSTGGLFTPDSIGSVIREVMRNFDPGIPDLLDQVFWNPPVGTPSLNRDTATQYANAFSSAIRRIRPAQSTA